MRVYPHVSRQRNVQIAIDVAVLIAVLLFLWSGQTVHDSVLQLTLVSTAITLNVAAAQNAWGDIGDTLGSIPFIGGQLKEAFDGLASGMFGSAAQAGGDLREAITSTANTLGLITALVPIAALLICWLPGRVTRARRWTAATQVLAGPLMSRAGVGPAVPGHDTVVLGGAATPSMSTTSAEAPGGETIALPWGDPSRGPVGGGAPEGGLPDGLLALRALCVVPYERLVAFTPRPFEAYAAGDFEPLVAALFDDAGMPPPS